MSARAEAKASGERKYFSGKPCNRGHLAERWTVNGRCVICTNIGAVERVRKWRAANPDIREFRATEAWLRRLRYPARRVADSRRVRKYGAAGSHSAADIEGLMEKQYGKCAMCGKDIRSDFEIDHVIALECGGRNDVTNLQLLCRTCNRRKGIS